MTPSTIVKPRSTSPPKSAWPGGVDDVDGDVVTVRGAVIYGGVLGQDRDSFFTFEVHGVHDSIVGGRSFTERTRLTEHGVDQSGFFRGRRGR